MASALVIILLLEDPEVKERASLGLFSSQRLHHPQNTVLIK